MTMQYCVVLHHFGFIRYYLRKMMVISMGCQAKGNLSLRAMFNRFGSVDYGINDLFDGRNRTQLPFSIANAAFSSLYYYGTCECTSITVNGGTEDVATYTAILKGTADLQGLTS